MAPALILLHGFTNTGASWDPVAAALGERYRAIAPDLRGHGGAAGLEPVTLEAVLRDLAAVVEGTGGQAAGDSQAGGRPTLAGYSMGGRIALHAALVLGARLGRLVLVGASPGIADPAERATRRSADERLAAELEELSIEELARRWATTPVLAGQPAAVQAVARADRLRSTPGGLARALRGLGTGALPPLWDRLPELALPTTLVVGERDTKFRAIAAEMASVIPGADVVVVSGAGHAVHLERPEAVAEILSTSP